MDIEAISGAGTVALVCTFLYLLVARSWGALSRGFNGNPGFANGIRHEAAQRFRDELQRLSASQSAYLGGLLVFALLFFAAYTLEAGQLFVGYPDWQLNLQLVFLALAASFILYELGITAVKRRRLRLETLANIAVGHRLQQIRGDSVMVFHDVETGAGMIDHLVIGRSGIYAVNVVFRRAPGSARVRLVDDALVFSNSSNKRPIDGFLMRTRALEKCFEQQLGYKVRVRSVVAVPGWESMPEASGSHILVSEQDVADLKALKTNADQLMTDDVDRLQQFMADRCLKSVVSAAG